MKKIVMTSPVFVRGVMVGMDKELTVKDNSDITNDEINPREAKELVARGAAVDADEVEETTEDDTTKPLEKMKKSELIEYATELGLEADDSMKNAELIELIQTFLDDEE